MTTTGFVLEIEQNLIGAVLSGGDQRATLARISSDHFLEPAHQELWRLICAAQEQYGTTTLPTVAKLATPEFAEDFLSKAGAPLATYMAGLVASTPFDGRNIKTGSKAVLGQWARMGIKAEAEAIAAAAADPATNPVELARAIVGRVDDIASHLRVGARTKTRQAFIEAA